MSTCSPFPAQLAQMLPVGEHGVGSTTSSPVFFPYDGSVIGQAPCGDARTAALALDQAAGMQAAMAATTTGARRALLMAIHDALASRGTELQELLVLETGKPAIDCAVEMARTLTTWQAAAEEVTRMTGETVPLDLQPLGAGMLGYYTRRPAGIVVGIAGFNYPVLLASHKIAPALAAGCPIIIKPSPDTPLATLWMVALIREVLAKHGLPRSIVQLVNGGIDVGERLVNDPRAAVVSFTGSADVGHQIARAAAPRKVVLELGSNTGLIVDADADLDAAVDAVIRGGFYANGQACISIQRVALHQDIAAEFTTKLAARMPEVVVGDPRDPATRVAPVINAASATRIRSWIREALDAGAQILETEVAPDNQDGTDALVRPTVLLGVPRNSALWAQEIFGPVLCLETVANIDEAIDLVNDSRYGLQAAIYTRSLANAFEAINRLDVGGVVVNEIPGFRSDIMPYGGVKDSGVGREGPRWAIEEFTITRMAMIRPA
ncbi:aldehyde dehydrogenase family protein [Paeniglutamicibacter gangotriensis]|uniref:Aldehyde dehydrogenase family protein n=1 Tax=Paeniglutamicibacter gangotriensis TaxID=254787 RepID=A0A5B0EAP8_9MICC|nr:aldehyde dehydrogenase family protein [Paeniglutamicibacter gangotriensis]KAA0974800.1 aldehyde dehydrogenase family protein [Paeniglutamicibacter gangotriensis]